MLRSSLSLFPRTPSLHLLLCCLPFGFLLSCVWCFPTNCSLVLFVPIIELLLLVPISVSSIVCHPPMPFPSRVPQSNYFTVEYEWVLLPCFPIHAQGQAFILLNGCCVCVCVCLSVWKCVGLFFLFPPYLFVSRSPLSQIHRFFFLPPFPFPFPPPFFASISSLFRFFLLLSKPNSLLFPSSLFLNYILPYL